MKPHNSPEYAAMRAFADLPVLPGDPALPERETFRARLLARDADTLRDRQRARLDNYLRGVLRVITPGDTLNRHYLVGGALSGQVLDILTMEEAQAWIVRAWEASRAAE